jgi:hypothetical protein
LASSDVKGYVAPASLVELGRLDEACAMISALEARSGNRVAELANAVLAFMDGRHADGVRALVTQAHTGRCPRSRNVVLHRAAPRACRRGGRGTRVCPSCVRGRFLLLPRFRRRLLARSDAIAGCIPIGSRRRARTMAARVCALYRSRCSCPPRSEPRTSSGKSLTRTGQ